MNLEKRKFILEKAKFLLAILLALFAAISMFISIKSCNISKEARKDAKDALQTSQCQFLQINRPYIILNPKKFDNGWFWKVDQNEKQVEITLKYEIKNVGNVTAKDISLPDKIFVGNLKNDTPVVYKKMGKVTLGPGDDFIIESKMAMGYENEELAKKQLDYLISDKSANTTFLLSVNYANELDESQKYRTFVENRIHNDKALLVKSEMLILPDNK